MSFEIKKVSNNLRNWWFFSMGRFRFNLNNLVSNAPNPYDQKLRPARTDLSHSYVDLFVELTRSSAYLIGHVLAVAVIALPVMVLWQ